MRKSMILTAALLALGASSVMAQHYDPIVLNVDSGSKVVRAL